MCPYVTQDRLALCIYSNVCLNISGTTALYGDEGSIIIPFATFIIVLLFFTGLYIYYVRDGRQKVDNVMKRQKFYWMKRMNMIG